MAVFGRRQPHAPLILRGGQNQPPKGRLLIVGQKTAQAAADRYYRRSFPPIIKRAGGRPSVARQLIVGQARQAAADRYFRRSFTGVVIKRAGPPPSVAHAHIVQAQAAWRPVRRPVFVSKPPPAPVVSTTPIGVYLFVGAKTAQAAADRFYRRAFAPIIKRAGGQPATSRVLIVGRIARDTARRPDSSIFSPRVTIFAAPTGAPIGAVLIFGQRTGQHAANRYYRRAFPPIVKRAGGQPAVGRELIIGRIARDAARRPDSSVFSPRVTIFGTSPPPSPCPPIPFSWSSSAAGSFAWSKTVVVFGWSSSAPGSFVWNSSIIAAFGWSSSATGSFTWGC